MQRKPLSPAVAGLLAAARRVAKEIDAAAIVMLSELPYAFHEIRKKLRGVRLLVASDNPDVQRAATADDVVTSAQAAARLLSEQLDDDGPFTLGWYGRIMKHLR